MFLERRMESVRRDSKIQVCQNKTLIRPEGLPRLFLIAFVAGLIIRLGWAVFPVERAQLDELGYANIAAHFAVSGEYAGRDISGGIRPTAYYPPGWPFLLAAAYKIFSPGVFTGRILTALFGASLIWLVFLVTSRIFGRRTGIFAAWMAAFHPILVYWSGVMMTEMPFAVFCLAGLCAELYLGMKPAGSALSGLLWGMLSMIRSTGFPMGAAILLWRMFPRGGNRAWKANIFFLATFLLLPAMWAVRNKMVFNVYGCDFHGGFNFFLGTEVYKENQINSIIAGKKIE